MNKETIQAILQFMERVQLTGKEAPALMKCVSELHEEYNRQEEPKKEEE